MDNKTPGEPQREPRPDQVRDKDAIRRYEMASDIDACDVVVYVNGNVLSLHEPSDVLYEKPKFKFVCKDPTDLVLFGTKIVLAITKKCDCSVFQLSLVRSNCCDAAVWLYWCKEHQQYRVMCVRCCKHYPLPEGGLVK